MVVAAMGFRWSGCELAGNAGRARETFSADPQVPPRIREAPGMTVDHRNAPHTRPWSRHVVPRRTSS